MPLEKYISKYVYDPVFFWFWWNFFWTGSKNVKTQNEISKLYFSLFSPLSLSIFTSFSFSHDISLSLILIQFRFFLYLFLFLSIFSFFLPSFNPMGVLRSHNTKSSEIVGFFSKKASATKNFERSIISSYGKQWE